MKAKQQYKLKILFYENLGENSQFNFITVSCSRQLTFINRPWCNLHNIHVCYIPCFILVIMQTFGVDVVNFKVKSWLARSETLLRIFCGIIKWHILQLTDTTKNPKQRFLMSQTRFSFKITGNNIKPKCLRDDHWRGLDLQCKTASLFLKNTLLA